MKEKGWRVFAAARKEADLAGLRAEGFEALHLDVADSASIRAAVDELLLRGGGRVDGLVNNAGYGQPGALEDLSRAEMRAQFEVNVFGLQELTNALLPVMLQAGRGRIVQVSSVVGRVALPFLGLYSASKFAVEALADAQRVELSGTGVWVSLVEPGPIVTAFSRNALAATGQALRATDSRFAALYARELSLRQAEGPRKPFSLPPEAVARAIDHALTARRPRRRYKVTLPAYLGALLSRLAPDGLIDAILAAELRRRRRFGESA